MLMKSTSNCFWKKKFWELDFKCDFSFLVFLVEWNLDKCFKKNSQTAKNLENFGQLFLCDFHGIFDWVDLEIFFSEFQFINPIFSGVAIIIGMFHRPHPTDRIAVPDTQAVLTNTTKADIRLLTRQDIEEDNREMTDLQTGTL